MGAVSLFLARWAVDWLLGSRRIEEGTPDRGAARDRGRRADAIMSASWGAGDSIVFARRYGGLWRVSARGGTPERLTTLDAGRRELNHRFPHLLPAGML
jgi:hypothetical protein